ncbi:MAG: Cdc6/Cdc18 family protein, partial [Candidatus Hodarchaeota archaeon]
QLINKRFPKRGYSSQDLLDILIDVLHRKNLHILIVLDELSYLINKHEDLIYSLTRINDDALKGDQRLSIIGIVRDISCLNNLDNSTLSTLQRNIIKFSKYSKDQIFDILKFRAEISLKKNILSDKLIEMISDLIFSTNDVRYGLNILWRACKIAENKSLKYITAECIRLGTQDLIPFSTLDILKDMTSQKLIFLLAIIKTLNNSENMEISFKATLKKYDILCENLELKPRSHSQLWNYLQELKRDSIIITKIISGGIKGRHAVINIPDLSLPNLENNIIGILNSRGFKV